MPILRSWLADFIGRDLDYDVLSRLPAEVDPCGENGEFHTFAHAGPMFSQPIPIRDGETVTRDGFLFADVLPDSEMVANYADRQPHEVH